RGQGPGKKLLDSGWCQALAGDLSYAGRCLVFRHQLQRANTIPPYFLQQVKSPNRLGIESALDSLADLTITWMCPSNSRWSCTGNQVRNGTCASIIRRHL